MSKGLRVSFGGVVFQSRPQDTAFNSGFAVSADGFKGWDGSVNVRREKVDRLYGHGSFSSLGSFADRAVTIEGYVLADSPRGLQFLIDRLNGLPRDLSPLHVLSHGRALRASACLESVHVDRARAGDTKARFQVVLWLPNPFKYGDRRDWSLRPGGSIDIHHLGNTDAYLELQFYAPLEAKVQLSLNGRTLTLAKRIVSGSFKHDTRTGRGGTSEQNSWLFGDTLVLPPGLPSRLSFTGSGAGSVRVSVIDTFI